MSLFCRDNEDNFTVKHVFAVHLYSFNVGVVKNSEDKALEKKEDTTYNDGPVDVLATVSAIHFNASPFALI